MTEFISYYWSPTLLQDRGLLPAVASVTKSDSPLAERAEAFKKLLDSDDVAAQGIAFDSFFYAESMLRHGLCNPFQIFSDNLLAKARNQLEHPPLDGCTPDRKLVAGANHASALGVITHLGNEDDIKRIATILGKSNDLNVIFEACLAAQSCLAKTSEYHGDIVKSLSRIVNNKNWPDNTRVAAVRAFSDYVCPEIENILVKFVQTTDLPISAHAAYILCYRDIKLYRDLLCEVASRWPSDAKYPANEVRALISEEE